MISNQEPIRGVSGQPLYHYLDRGKYKIECLDQGAKIGTVVVEIDEI